MKRNMSLASAIFVFLLATLFPVRAATFNIDIKNFAFSPANQTIQVGDTVTWMNSDISQHTTTSGQPSAPDGIWNGSLSQGQSFSHTFDSAGTFAYYCAIHPFMVGSIIVEGAQGTPPTVSITSPANNATLPAGNVTIEATASATGGNITQIEFFDAANSIGVVTASPYKVTVNLTAGTHSLTAKATDSNGGSATSAAISVTVGGGGTKIDDPIPAKIAKGNITIELQTVADGLISPLGSAVPDDGSGRMFVYDQVGLVYVIKNGAKMDAPLLDVRSRLVSLDPGYDERGLIGLAVHPNFSQHPFIYTYTSEPNGPMADFMIMMDGGKTNDHQSVIAEWKIDTTDSNKVDVASRREILRVDKPQSNHNGGTLRFGPDGFLYFTIGDGGAADDQGDGHCPNGNGQDKTKILGKVSRIDVEARTSGNGQYGIPTDNPFINEAGSVAEIYAYGLRNPYSFSFDRGSGDLLLADVGQNDVEEVDKILKGGNYGWRIKEGSFFFDPNGENDGFVTTQPVRDVPPDLVDPIAEFDHDEGDAIIGGYVYRGTAISALAGKYLAGSWGEFSGPEGRLFYLDGSDLKELKIGSDDRKLGLWLKGYGEDANGELYIFGSTDLGPTGTSGKMLKIVPEGAFPPENGYVQHNLVSDVPGLADHTDSQLVNPWGIATSSSSPFWISDNHAGVSTLYDSSGNKQTLIVTIPGPAGGTPPSAPTGVIFNNTADFQVNGAPSRFIFVGEDGVVSAWASGANAILMVDNSASEAIYKGLAQGSSGGANYLYAADFHNGKIDVFDSTFKPATLAGSFTDPTIPSGFAPFNVMNIGGQLYVTYAKQDEDKEDDVAGPGNGYVDIFDTAGNFVKRFISQGALNSPWGVVMARTSFGPVGGKLLVGNFGDGTINAYDPGMGEWLGQLKDPKGNTLAIEGLWDLKFGNGGNGGDPNVLYFTAGISGGGALEDHGLFGSIASVRPPNAFTQHNLVSDIAGLADHTDPQLVNPWGIATTPTSPFWISDNHAGVSTLYDSGGVKQALVVTIPTPAGGTPPSAPTGIIFNNTTDFQVNGAAARFIFLGEDGVVSAWASGNNAVSMADNSASEAIYKGLAQGSSGGANYLYAADFHNGKIDVFESTFKPATLAGSFSDPNIPAGFAPFNVANIGGQLYVTYAKQDDDKEDDVAGPGNGYVDVFDTAGNLVRRFLSQGALNSPWAVVVAPAGFGPFGGALLIGNFGASSTNRVLS